MCEYCAITCKDNELIQGKSRRALVKHAIKFCERDELLAMEDEGMSMLLDLNDTLEAMLESRLKSDATGSTPLVSSPAVGEGEEEAIQAAVPTSEAPTPPRGQIHIVVSQKGENSPVYEVKPERGTSRGRILHRNMLMPCHALLLEEPVQTKTPASTKEKPN